LIFFFAIVIISQIISVFHSNKSSTIDEPITATFSLDKICSFAKYSQETNFKFETSKISGVTQSIQADIEL
jgi:hypothetical protein